MADLATTTPQSLLVNNDDNVNNDNNDGTCLEGIKNIAFAASALAHTKHIFPEMKDGVQHKIGCRQLYIEERLSNNCLVSGCGSVERAVPSDSRGPRFESSHWQNLN